MKNIFLSLLFFGFFLSHGNNNSTVDFTSSIIIEDIHPSDVDYSIWAMMLQMYVDKEGNVDYSGFKKKEKVFDEFLKNLSNARFSGSWTVKDRIAFWINVYNAYTIKLILNNYPVKSIKEIKRPWDKKFFVINGEELSLGDVEHEILRKKFTEPRIHFAINCASKSCPRVIQIPYESKNLDKLLDRQTREYINNSKVNYIGSKSYELSKLFSWFSKDFNNSGGGVENFINMYSNTPIKTQKNKGFLSYNWELNTK